MTPPSGHTQIKISRYFGKIEVGTLQGPSGGLDLFAVHPQGSLQESLAGGTKYKWQGPMQEAQGIRVVGGKDP